MIMDMTAGQFLASIAVPLRRSRAADLCDIIAGQAARMTAMDALRRELTASEEAEYSGMERDIEASRAELASLIQQALGVSPARLEAAL